MTWYFNDQVIEAGDRYMITFDGTYATLFIASCVMADMGEYKVVFENSAGTDQTTGKVTVKPREVSVSCIFTSIIPFFVCPETFAQSILLC
jgi:hypothetical protein